MELSERYEIASTASYIRENGFSRVALQFPDDLLAESVAVTSALQGACGSSVRFFVMADTTFGSCCVDEVAASHADAECVVHYGPACLSPVSRIPAWFVFVKSPLDVQACGDAVASLASEDEPLVVLYDLEYAHAIAKLIETIRQKSSRSSSLTFAEVVGKQVTPCCESEESWHQNGIHSIAGLKWSVPTMEGHRILWIGNKGPALTNAMLTYNHLATVRYDPAEGLQINAPSEKAALLRRYYLIERAKDANIVGIVPGTLGVAGYRQAIQKLKRIIKNAGKKSYTLAVGKPNPAKLANFTECDVFVLVACPQTALIDSKEYLAPVLTTFEAQLAFVRGAEWTGAYSLDFRDIKVPENSATQEEEPHFSLIKGGYISSTREVETNHDYSDLVASDRNSSIGALSTSSRQGIKTASDFFASRSFQGLELEDQKIRNCEEMDLRAVEGRKGRAAVYEHEH